MAKRDSVVLALYFALALALTYPLVTRLGDHVPGSETWAFDEYSFVWSQWWVRHALFNLGANPLITRYVFYPLGLNLASFTILWTHAILGLPLQFAFGLIPAVNATVLSTFVFGAFGMYLLAGYLLRTTGIETRRADLAAIVAGVVFGFSSSRMVYAALGHYTVLAAHWFPFYILFLIKTMRAPAWSNPILAGVFASLSFYSDAAHAPLLVLFTLLYLTFERRALFQRVDASHLHLRAAQVSRRLDNVSPWRSVRDDASVVWMRLVGVGAAAALFCAPLLLPLFNQIALSDYELPGWGHAERLLVDLMGFFAPTSLHPLNRDWVQELDQVRQQISRFSDVHTFFVGYATALLALLGALAYRKRLGVWIVSALVFASFTLGPLLNIGGQSVFDLDGLQVTFPMPFLLLHYIPFLKENRVPNRYSILVMLSLAVLIGYAVAWVLQAASSKHPSASSGAAGRNAIRLGVCGLLLAALLFEHLAIPLPLTNARVPEVYRQIAQEPGDFAILSLPLGWRNSFTTLGAEDTRTQSYQSVHGKYLLAGNTSRNPPFLFEYFDRISLFHSLTEVEMYRDVSAETLARDRAAAPSLTAFFDIRYVVVNAATPKRLPYSDTRGAVVDYAQKVLPLGEKIYDRDGVVAYRVNQAPLPAQQQIAFGTDAAHLYQAEGWDRDETIADARANWANRREARVLFPLREIADYQLIIRALPFAYPQSPAQTIEILVNGQAIQKFEMKAGWDNYAATIPARVLRSGLNDLVLGFGYAVRPRDVMPANFAVGGTGVTSAADIVVNAAALGSIRVNGHEASPLGRGYNVVVIDPKRGAVVNAKVFNTADEKAASRALTDFVAQIPIGFIVAVASHEEVAANLGDRAVAALRSIGAQVDVRQTPNRSHALIGVKGAAPGSAVEQSSEGTAFIWVGHSPDERTLAAAVSAITIERK